jgi:outer membrane receptor protein involved in Fe transport
VSIALGARLSVGAGLDLTHARVDGGTAAADLTGLQPAETPAAAATASVDWRPRADLRLIATARYEARRYVDDQNKLSLAPDTVANLRAEYSASTRLTVFVAADNLFYAKVQQNESVLGLYSYGAPRLVSLGLRLTSR